MQVQEIKTVNKDNEIVKESFQSMIYIFNFNTTMAVSQAINKNHYELAREKASETKRPNNFKFKIL